MTIPSKSTRDKKSVSPRSSIVNTSVKDLISDKAKKQWFFEIL